MSELTIIGARLEYLRGQIQAECISYGEIAELQGLAPYIDPGDVELLAWAGVPEFPEKEEADVQEDERRPWIAAVSEDDLWLIREALILMGTEFLGSNTDGRYTYEQAHPGIAERVSELAEALGVTA